MPAEADRHNLQTYLALPLSGLESELELYAPSARGPAEVWEDIAAPLRQRLCVEWDYCTARQDARLDDDLALALLVLGALTERALHLPFPVDSALLAVIVVKRGLDAFCNCP